MVLRTVDGGNTWTPLPVTGAESLDFRGIKAFDADHALIMSSGLADQGKARIYSTADAGKSWQQVFASSVNGVFLDAIASGTGSTAWQSAIRSTVTSLSSLPATAERLGKKLTTTTCLLH